NFGEIASAADRAGQVEEIVCASYGEGRVVSQGDGPIPGIGPKGTAQRAEGARAARATERQRLEAHVYPEKHGEAGGVGHDRASVGGTQRQRIFDAQKT